MSDAMTSVDLVRPDQNDTAGTTALSSSAIAYAEHGIHIFPCWWTADGHCGCGNPNCGSPGKHPIGRLAPNGVHDATNDIDTVTAWWTEHPAANIGIALAPNNMFVLDVDGPEGRAHLDELEALYDVLPETYQVVTGRTEGSGRHHIYRQPPEGPRVGNAKLGHPKLETKGDGGYVIAPPSIHVSGRAYLAVGKWSQIVDAPRWLVALATKPKPDPAPITDIYADVSGSDDLARRRLDGAAGKVALALEGERNDVLNWAAHTAGRLIGAGRLDRQHVEQTLTVAAQRAGLTAGETAATIRSGIEAGIKDPDYDQPVHTPDLAPLTVIDEPNDRRHPENSWAPVDPTSYIDGTYTPPQPTQLVRNDGTALFYPGRINLLFGESEAGKGWVALHAVAQALARGDQVLYIDFEDYPDTIYARLMLLGADRDALTYYFNYIRPDVALDDTGRAALGAAINTLAPHLVVLDGVTGAMSLHGLDTNSSTDVDQFYSLLGEPLARIGAAVVFIDHVTKSAETRGKGPIGSQHKRARVSGASYEVSTATPIAPGRAGKLRLKIDKDRLGAVRSVHPTHAGEFHLDSTGDRSHAHLHAPASGDEPFRPTKAMEHVSRGLEDAGDQGLSVRGIEELGDFSKDTLKKAAEQLVEEGYAAREAGPRNALIHKFVRRFTAGPTVLDDTTVPEPCPPSPTVPDDPGTVGGADAAPTVPASPPLYRRGTGDGREPDPKNTRREVPL